MWLNFLIFSTECFVVGDAGSPRVFSRFRWYQFWHGYTVFRMHMAWKMYLHRWFGATVMGQWKLKSWVLWAAVIKTGMTLLEVAKLNLRPFHETSMDQGKLIFLKLNPNSPGSFDVVKMAGKEKPLNTETLEILIFQEKRSTFKNAEHGYWYIIIMIHDCIV